MRITISRLMTPLLFLLGGFTAISSLPATCYSQVEVQEKPDVEEAAEEQAQQQAVVDRWTDGKSANLDEFLTTMFEKKKFNGSVLIAEDGEIVYEKWLGWANINEQKELEQDSSFRLASVSKQFTAMCIMILAEQGKLDYDDDIKKYIPEMPCDGITVRHLLHHTGGLIDYMTLFGFQWDADKPAEERKTAFNKDLVDLFVKHKPTVVFEPGEKWDYSNTGYVLLGHIIEVASGQPVHEFYQEHIFDKIGMNHSRCFTDDDAFKLKDRVYGFSYTEGGDSHVDNDWNFLNGMIGDGGVYASARDMFAWDQALYSNALVSQETMKEAFTSGRTNDGEETGYGFGWSIVTKYGEPTEVRHSGGWVGFRTFIHRNLAEKRTIVILTNCAMQEEFGQIMEGISKLSANEHAFAERVAREAIEMTEDELAPFVGKYNVEGVMKINFSIEDGVLHGEPEGQRKLPLVAYGNDEFAAEEVGAEVSFERDEDGNVTGLLLKQRGMEAPGKRIEE